MSIGAYDIVSADSYDGGCSESYGGGPSGDGRADSCGEFDLYNFAK